MLALSESLINKKIQLITLDGELNYIFKLRVFVWRNSVHGHKINNENFPNGWSDELDRVSYHLAIKTELNEIIASARITIISDGKDLPYFNLFAAKTALKMPLAFFSRLVVHPRFQNSGLSKLFDFEREKIARSNFCKMILCTTHGRRIEKLKSLGFVDLGRLKTERIKSWILTNQEYLLVKRLDNEV